MNQKFRGSIVFTAYTIIMIDDEEDEDDVLTLAHCPGT